MLLLGKRLKPGKLRRVIALCLIQISLFFGLAISDIGNAASAQPLTKEAESYQFARTTSEPVDLDQAANKAEEASEKIFEGSDKTKSWMSNKEKTDQAIEHAREEASKKWKSLADKARRTQNSNESLSLPEKKVLEHVQGENK